MSESHKKLAKSRSRGKGGRFVIESPPEDNT